MLVPDLTGGEVRSAAVSNAGAVATACKGDGACTTSSFEVGGDGSLPAELSGDGVRLPPLRRALRSGAGREEEDDDVAEVNYILSRS